MDNLIIGAYGLLMLAGAFFGLKAGSKISLIMGLVSGVLVFLGYWLVITAPAKGFLFLSVLSGLLTVVFLMRLIKTKKAMPSGMLLAVTALFLFFCLSHYFKI